MLRILLFSCLVLVSANSGATGLTLATGSQYCASVDGLSCDSYAVCTGEGYTGPYIQSHCTTLSAFLNGITCVGGYYDGDVFFMGCPPPHQGSPSCASPLVLDPLRGTCGSPPPTCIANYSDPTCTGPHPTCASVPADPACLATCDATKSTNVSTPVTDSSGQPCLMVSGGSGGACANGQPAFNARPTVDANGCPVDPNKTVALGCYSVGTTVSNWASGSITGGVIQPGATLMTTANATVCTYTVTPTGVTALMSAASAVAAQGTGTFDVGFGPQPMSLSGSGNGTNAQNQDNASAYASSVSSAQQYAVSAVLATGASSAVAIADAQQALANCVAANNCSSSQQNMLSQYCLLNPTDIVCIPGSTFFQGLVSALVGSGVSSVGAISGVGYSASGVLDGIGNLASGLSIMSSIVSDFTGASGVFYQPWTFFFPTNGGGTDAENCSAMMTAFGIGGTLVTTTGGAVVPDICTNTYMLALPDFVDWVTGILCCIGIFLMFYDTELTRA